MQLEQQIPVLVPGTDLELLARQVVEGFIIGLHKSPFHGFSVEFAEHRLYNPGDALKHIDWKVLGRTDRLYVKKFEEETNLRCYLLMDNSASMYYHGSDKKPTKLQYSCVAAAAITCLMKKQLDAAGLITFNETLEQQTPCKSSAAHFKTLYRELQQLFDGAAGTKRTATPEVLHLVAENIHKRSLVILFSDMLDAAGDQDELFSALQHLKYNKHEVILFYVTDHEKELRFEFDNRPYEFIDMETGEKLKLHPAQVKENYLAQMEIHRKQLLEKCKQFHIDVIDADINKPYDQILLPYLLKRNKML